MKSPTNRARKSTASKSKEKRIELRAPFTKQELDGLAFLQEHFHEKTAAGALKQCLAQVKAIVADRDSCKLNLQRRNIELSEVINRVTTIDSSKKNLLQYIGKIELTSKFF